MRAHNSEHRDSLPVLDVTALRHVAYVLDAVIFYMRASNELDCDRNDSNAWDDQDDNENDDVDDEFTTSLVMDTDSIDDSDMVRPSLGKRHGFFQRSESTLCLGCPAPDSFNTPMAEALPLADQPQLLQPNARREDLFGMPKQAITVPTGDQSGSSTLELPPIRLGLSSQSKGDVAQNNTGNTNTVVICSVNPSTSESQNEPSVEEHQKVITRSSRVKTVMSKDQEVVSLKRVRSPQPGPSNIQKHFEEYDDDDESGDDEPQDLSQQTLSNTSNKIDESSAAKTAKPVGDDYEDSEESDGENDSNMMRSPAHKKHRLMDNDQVQPEEFAMLQSDSKPSDDQEQLNDQEVDPSIRPPIIVVTRRNVADAIEAVTANVLSKNKKTSLIDCVAPETPLTFLPNNFVYEGKAGEGDQGASSSKSSVIVRVGPSVSTFYSL